MSKRLIAIVLVAAALSAAIGVHAAFAGSRAHAQRAEVTSCSRYGNGCASAPVRAGRFGIEMRLKGGTWIDCKSDCRQTLREETVDFWDTQREKNGGRR